MEGALKQSHTRMFQIYIRILSLSLSLPLSLPYLHTSFGRTRHKPASQHDILWYFFLRESEPNMCVYACVRMFA